MEQAVHNNAGYTAALVFLEESQKDSLDLCQIYQRILRQKGFDIDKVSAPSLAEIHIEAGQVLVTMGQSLLHCVDDRLMITLTVRPASSPLLCRFDDATSMQAALARLTSAFATATRPEFIQWLHPDTVLPTEEFQKAVQRQMPRAQKSKRPTYTGTAEATLCETPHEASYEAPTTAPAAVTVANANPAKRFPDIESASHVLTRSFDRREKSRLRRPRLTGIGSLARSLNLIDDTTKAKAEQRGVLSWFRRSADQQPAKIPLTGGIAAQLVLLAGLVLVLNSAAAMAYIQ